MQRINQSKGINTKQYTSKKKSETIFKQQKHKQLNTYSRQKEVRKMIKL